MVRTNEEKVQFLSEKINILTDQYDEDFHSLYDCKISEELLSSLVEEALIKEIEKLICVFEAFNPDVYIHGISRKYNEEGEAVVYLDWYEVSKDK